MTRKRKDIVITKPRPRCLKCGDTKLVVRENIHTTKPCPKCKNGNE